ncbi:MAG: 4-alpha-glucanotransferase [Cyanobacteria bacterium CRU_2_1]|nr:4-alpha-glucanotransferase [Cyanobacteria bacterium RU_5_0]NJR59749.1 4-alpha-glucanotransferase [Cyanobacteria bacterium CRU_2_1]
MPFPRSSGILLHPTSFPSRFGIGDLGSEAYQFVNFLVASGQRIWQILPLGPTGYGDSPYQCFSAIAGNPLLISPDRLRDEGLLTDTDLSNVPQFPLQVDFGWVIHTKIPLLRTACHNFQRHASSELKAKFAAFCEAKAAWLEDYALFRALKDAHGGTSWHEWETSIAKRKPDALERWRQQLAPEIFFHKFLQFKFFHQWTELKTYANDRGIQILGDLPIYLAHDSAEVWAHPEHFCLDEETGLPALMAGVPPDYFSPTGQLWGNPLYDWEQLQEEDFRWWMQRFKTMLDCVDLIRIDHFRGFEAYWAVPKGETTAINGEWMNAPGKELFKQLEHELGSLPIVAEDLGFITPEVEALRDEFEFPGMKILHFAFDSGSDNPYLPFNIPHNCLIYTGTHDNDTTMGWFNKRSPEDQDRVRRYFGYHTPNGIHWDLIRLAYSSIANQAIIPLQDFLGLDSEARMNEPSRPIGNWGWRYQAGVLTDDLAEQIRSMIALYGRLSKTT